MSSTGKEPATDEIRTDSPVLHPGSPHNSLSARLQEEYSELLKYTAGMPDRRSVETSGQTFQPISKAGSLSARQTPVDKKYDSSESIQENGVVGNVNTNALYSTQSQKFKNHATTRAPDANVNKYIKNEDDEAEEYSFTTLNATDATIIEPALACLGGKLDIWLRKLKCNVMEEVKCLTLHALESQKLAHCMEIQKLNCDKHHLVQEVNRLNEMVNTFEQSISRKDTVIDNVTQALGRQRSKVTMAQAFYHTRAENAEAKKEKFTESLAAQHNSRRLTQKVLKAWFGLIQSKWKNRFENIYDEKAQDVCKQLSLDYEDKIKAMNAELENMNKKLKFLQNEREQYALQVKKAFMRGVCALNMETMSAFTQEEAQVSPFSENNSNVCNINENHEPEVPQKDDPHIKFASVDMTSSAAPDMNLGDGQFSSLSVIGTGHSQQSKFKQQKGKTRPSTAPNITSYQTKTWGTNQPLAPPMASVIVERHDPITKTVGKAVASRYPKHSINKSSGSHAKHKQDIHSAVSKSIPVSQVCQIFQPLAGQSASVTTAPGIKVVE